MIDPVEILQHAGAVAGSRIADLGCGRVGQFVFPASLIVGDVGTVYAADIQKNAVQAIKSASEFRHFENVKTIWTDLEQVGMARIPQGTIDIALLVTTLLHSKQRDAMIEEAVRLLKPGGRLVVVDWLAQALASIEPTTQAVEPQEVIETTKRHRLALTESFAAGKYHFALIFTKATE